MRDEEAFGIDALELGDRLAVGVDEGDGVRLGKEDADGEAVRGLVHAEIGKRIVMVGMDDRVDRPLLVPCRQARRLGHCPSMVFAAQFCVMAPAKRSAG